MQQEEDHLKPKKLSHTTEVGGVREQPVLYMLFMKKGGYRYHPENSVMNCQKAWKSKGVKEGWRDERKIKGGEQVARGKGLWNNLLSRLCPCCTFR